MSKANNNEINLNYPEEIKSDSSHTKPKRSENQNDAKEVKVRTKMNMNQFSEISSDASFLDSEEGVAAWDKAPDRYGGKGYSGRFKKNPFTRDRVQSNKGEKPVVESDGKMGSQMVIKKQESIDVEEGISAKQVNSKRTTVQHQGSSSNIGSPEKVNRTPLPVLNLGARQKYLAERRKQEANRGRVVNKGDEYEGDDGEEDALIFHSVSFLFVPKFDDFRFSRASSLRTKN